jgi:hypothetical protein
VTGDLLRTSSDDVMGELEEWSADRGVWVPMFPLFAGSLDRLDAKPLSLESAMGMFPEAFAASGGLPRWTDS